MISTLRQTEVPEVKKTVLYPALWNSRMEENPKERCPYRDCEMGEIGVLKSKPSKLGNVPFWMERLFKNTSPVCKACAMAPSVSLTPGTCDSNKSFPIASITTRTILGRRISDVQVNLCGVRNDRASSSVLNPRARNPESGLFPISCCRCSAHRY